MDTVNNLLNDLFICFSEKKLTKWISLKEGPNQKSNTLSSYNTHLSFIFFETSM